jgi:uncharacterized membrane protein YhiD involved in acid resistance
MELLPPEFMTELTEQVSVDMLVILPRMLAAVLIGAALSTRPWRLLFKRPLPKMEMIQAQILLCAAAAVITAVIGNSVAKAFGLVGLGGFVRFRSGLKDPRDAAILFLMIGLGMACGHGSLGLALGGTVFLGVLLWVLDLIYRDEPQIQRLKLLAQSDDVAGAEQRLRQALGERNVVVTSCALDFANRKMELELEERVPGSVAHALSAAGENLKGLKWSTINGKAPKEEWV